LFDIGRDASGVPGVLATLARELFDVAGGGMDWGMGLGVGFLDTGWWAEAVLAVLLADSQGVAWPKIGEDCRE
jgi:hypothetical protein